MCLKLLTSCNGMVFGRSSLSVLSLGSLYLSLVMRKPAFCICENKDSDQLRCNCEAEADNCEAGQGFCFCYLYTDSTIPLLLKSEILSL